MVAGSFMANSDDINISLVGSFFFVSGFFGILWCVLDNLQIYTSGKLMKLLNISSIILLSTVVYGILISLILVLFYAATTIKITQSPLLMGFRFFLASAYIMIFYLHSSKLILIRWPSQFAKRNIYLKSSLYHI